MITQNYSGNENGLGLKILEFVHLRTMVDDDVPHRSPLCNKNL